MKRIQIDEDIQRLLVSRAVDIGESASSILRRALHLAPPATESIEIDDDVYAYLVSRTAAIGESASSILRRELQLAAPGEGPGDGEQPGNPQPRQPSIVEFHIPLGTANNAWNAREQAVAATVNDTLRIVNSDAVPHQLHTPGSPFPHPGADIPPGQSADYILTSPFDPAINGALSDHLFGSNARF